MRDRKAHIKADFSSSLSFSLFLGTTLLFSWVQSAPNRRLALVVQREPRFAAPFAVRWVFRESGKNFGAERGEGGHEGEKEELLQSGLLDSTRCRRRCFLGIHCMHIAQIVVILSYNKILVKTLFQCPANKFCFTHRLLGKLNVVKTYYCRVGEKPAVQLAYHGGILIVLNQLYCKKK